MTKTQRSEPWHALPPALADAIEPELPKATEEILETIGREVPEYARPLEGAFGVAIRTGVSEALRQFVELIRDPKAVRGRDVYVGLGRAEFREGRTLDSLQSAYRVGARVAWRRVSAAARRANVDPEQLGLLAEAVFAYIDELSADSVEGYAQSQREQEGERQRRRRELLALLLRDPPAGDPEIRSSAAGGGVEAGAERGASRGGGGGPGPGRPPALGGRAGGDHPRRRLRARPRRCRPDAHGGAGAGDPGCHRRTWADGPARRSSPRPGRSPRPR